MRLIEYLASAVVAVLSKPSVGISPRTIACVKNDTFSPKSKLKMTKKIS